LDVSLNEVRKLLLSESDIDTVTFYTSPNGLTIRTDKPVPKELRAIASDLLDVLGPDYRAVKFAPIEGTGVTAV
jgi:hypothetical protein